VVTTAAERAFRASVPPAYYSACLGNWPDEVVAKVRTWVRGTKTNLVLVGPSWSGKSTLAAAALREALACHVPDTPPGPWEAGLVRWVPTRDLPNRDDLLSCRWLVIDGLGSETFYGDVWGQALWRVVAHRWEQALPTVLTTIWTPPQIKSTFGPSLHRRLTSGAVMVGLKALSESEQA